MKNRPGEKIKLASLDELLGVVNEESAMEIEINKIHAFKNHPFKVLDDEKMQDLIESVKLSGVLTPVLLRVDSNDEYEMISGHRRLHAAKMAGLTTIPAIVRELSDDDAVIAMVDANIQREELLPSEKAFAYRMKLEAMKRQGSRTDITSGQNDQKLTGAVSRDILAQQVGESSKQVQRYIRLTELIPELLDIPRKSASGHEYIFSEGPIAFPDPWDRPGRTMLTSESTLNRSTHVVADPSNGKLRILTPVEAERLQGFDDDWTNSGMPQRMRFFCMGNALVVPMVTRMGKVLDEIIKNEP